MTGTLHDIVVEPISIDDYDDFKASMEAAYAKSGLSTWRKEKIEKLIRLFPEGQIGLKANGKLIGCALTIVIDSKQFEERHTYRDAIGNYSFDTHNPEGDLLYGIELFVHPDFRGQRLGRRLYDARKLLCEELNLRGIVFGGRLPNYGEHAEFLKPREYIDAVERKEIYDPVLSFQLSNDFRPVRVLRGYMPEDKSSNEYAALLRWDNIYYEDRPYYEQELKIIRLGLIQWQMRRVDGIDPFLEQMEFFVDIIGAYNADFAVFPEFFNAPLMAPFGDLTEYEAIRKLAQFVDPIREKGQELAVRYNVNIILGAMPCLEGDVLYNRGFLCTREGSYEPYGKIHITPTEYESWGVTGADDIKVFDTDCGKVGVLICYDVEFPEVARIMADKGMRILFVPFQTDTQNGYTRVRACAQARAIENECYVAIAGSVGNLPRVRNMDIQFSQSAVFTPSDFAFPTNGVKAETTPNTEMVLLADVDISLLQELHSYGSVRVLKDRRLDLYEVSLKDKGSSAT